MGKAVIGGARTMHADAVITLNLPGISDLQFKFELMSKSSDFLSRTRR
jgi:hypothetical protein